MVSLTIFSIISLDISLSLSTSCSSSFPSVSYFLVISICFSSLTSNSFDLLPFFFSSIVVTILVQANDRDSLYLATYLNLYVHLFAILARALGVPVVGVRAVDCWQQRSGHYFHQSFPFFPLFPQSRPFLIEGVLGSKNLFSESCLERPKT